MNDLIRDGAMFVFAAAVGAVAAMGLFKDQAQRLEQCTHYPAPIGDGLNLRPNQD